MDESVCNSKQKWNHDGSSCECTKLVDWCSCRDDYMWNPSMCNCKTNKAGKIDKYLDPKNCSYENVYLVNLY